MKTYQPKQKEIKRQWHLLDAKDAVLGRLSTQIASLLMGKGKESYSRHMDSGDNVVVINAKQVKLTGNKEMQKVYQSHSGYPGGFKEVAISKVRDEHPNRIIEKAVSGMLPDNRLKKLRMARLFVFKDGKHKFDGKFN